MLRPNIQLFADEGTAPETNPAPASEPAAAAAPAKSATPEPQQASGKTFSQDYVHDLREESKGYRQAAKTYENALRKVLNVPDGEDLGNIEKRITAMNDAQAKAAKDALAMANARLIAAEMKALDGYDQKLLAKVIDMNKISVDENGEVKGVKEAAEEAAKEYPAVLNKTPAKYSAGTGSAPVGEKYGKDMLAFRNAAGLKN